MSDSEKGAPDPLGKGAKPEKKFRAVFYIPNCRTLRVNKGKQIAELAKAADVNRSTIEKIEKLIGVTDVFARRIFNVLDEWHPALHLKADREITMTPSKIQNPLDPSAQKKRPGV
jgi:DNA-binding XRE family transcriptional regulator